MLVFHTLKIISILELAWFSKNYINLCNTDAVNQRQIESLFCIASQVWMLITWSGTFIPSTSNSLVLFLVDKSPKMLWKIQFWMLIKNENYLSEFSALRVRKWAFWRSTIPQSYLRLKRRNSAPQLMHMLLFPCSCKFSVLKWAVEST